MQGKQGSPPSPIDLEEINFKTIFNLIYRDQFKLAYEKLDEWSIEEVKKSTSPLDTGEGKDERIFNLMKLIKYCEELIPFRDIEKIPPGEDRYHFWQKQWNLFEEFVKNQLIYHEANYLGMKNYFYQKMIDHLVLEFNSQSYYNPIMLEACKRLLEIGSWDKVEEGLTYLRNQAPKLLPEINLQLVELYYYQSKTSPALQLLKDTLFHYPQIDLRSLPIPEVKAVIRELFFDGFTPKEIQIWLPAFLRLRKVLPVFYSLETEDYKKAILYIDDWEKSHYENEQEYLAHIVYLYLYISDQLYTRIVKGKTYFQDDLNYYLNKLQKTNSFFYQQVQTSYEHR